MMGMKEEAKAAIDKGFPPLPASRRTSRDVNVVMTQTNDLYAAAMEGKQDKVARVIATVLRPLNAAFRLSETRDSQVSYSVDIACSAPLGVAGQSGTVFLEIATNSVFTAGVTVISQSTQSASGLLNLATTGTGNVSGIIPAGCYARLRTANNTGAPTFTARTAQEVLL